MHRTLTRILIAGFFSLTSLAFPLDVEKDIVTKAKAFLGHPYKTGGAAPPEFDCSGFVSYIMKPFVPKIPRLSRDMADFGQKINKTDLQTGDLVFFATTNVRGAVSHVALYIGGGNIIHAISDGPERGVTITPLEAGYWKTRYHSAVRVLPASVTVQKPNTPTAPEKPAASPAKPADSPSTAQPSPWDTFDGFIEGDYAQWKAKEEAQFKEFKDGYDPQAEGAAFEAWNEGKPQ